MQPVRGPDAYATEPGDAAGRIRAMAASGRMWAVCTQDMVIRGLVTALADRDGLPLPQVPTNAGSAWALFFRSGRLVAADYHRPTR